MLHGREMSQWADCVAKLKNELAAKIRVAPGETGI
jgi:hypothetical protein